MALAREFFYRVQADGSVHVLGDARERNATGVLHSPAEVAAYVERAAACRCGTCRACLVAFMVERVDVPPFEPRLVRTPGMLYAFDEGRGRLVRWEGARG